jgi:hypothetical protein
MTSTRPRCGQLRRKKVEEKFKAFAKQENDRRQNSKALKNIIPI